MKLNDLKKNVFFELLNLVGRVYMVVRYSPDVDLGRKVFTEDEKANGLTLVFTTRMNIQWDAVGLSTTLSFGAQAYRCFIPSKDILAIYSPELQVQFTTAPQELITGTDPEPKKAPCAHPCPEKLPIRKAAPKRGALIEVDFATRLRKKKETTGKGEPE
jgi:hypothetical protein